MNSDRDTDQKNSPFEEIRVGAKIQWTLVLLVLDVETDSPFAQIGVGAEIQWTLALLVLDVEIGSAGSEEAGDRRRRFLVRPRRSQPHQKWLNLEREEGSSEVREMYITERDELQNMQRPPKA